jgi:2-iminobutanoate/2-iminopropanoate deaminase
VGSNQLHSEISTGLLLPVRQKTKGVTMLQKQIISTQDAPRAIGPYSQGVKIGDLVYTAGQIALVPQTGKLVEGGIEAQTRQVMKNLAAILEAAGASLVNVVKTTIFLTDMNDFAQVNQVYGSFFHDAPPARSTVQVSGLPLGARIEIEVIAVLTQA